MEKVLWDECIDVITKVISKDRHLELESSGNSMRPLIGSGECVLIGYSKPEEVKVGDIVLTKDRGNLHRVIEIQHNNEEIIFTTKGDYCLHIDPPIHKDLIIGRVISVGGRRVDSMFWVFYNKIIAFFSLMQGRIYALATRNVFYRRVYLRVDIKLRKIFAFLFRLMSNPVLIVLGVYCLFRQKVMH